MADKQMDLSAGLRDVLTGVRWHIEQHQQDHGAVAEHLSVELNLDTLEDWRDDLAALVARAERQGREVDEDTVLTAARRVGERVAGEIGRQFGKWGAQDHAPLYWFGIVSEEVGEVAKALIGHDSAQARTEIVESVASLVQLYAALEEAPDADR